MDTLPNYMSLRRSETVVWNSDYKPSMEHTDPERKEAIQHLQAELLRILLQEINPSSDANRRKRLAICRKLRKWGKKCSQ